MVSAVIVLGHHRGGTSLVAGILEQMGVRMGPPGAPPDWSSPHWSNPTGHFENPEIVWVNASILGFDRPGVHESPSWYEVPKRAEPQRARIAATMRRHEEPGGLWGWKDPWSVLTVEEFLPFVTDPKFVVVHRDPKSVADSLRRRDAVPPVESERVTALWETKLREVVERHPGVPRCELDFEAVTRAPSEALDRLGPFLGIAVTDPMRERASRLVMDGESLKRLARRLAFRELSTFPKWLLWFLRDRLRYHQTAHPREMARSAWAEFLGVFRTAAGT